MWHPPWAFLAKADLCLDRLKTFEASTSFCYFPAVAKATEGQVFMECLIDFLAYQVGNLARQTAHAFMGQRLGQF